MKITEIAGSNRTLGEAQGFRGLPIKDIITIPDGESAMVSEWAPTQDEIKKLAAGAVVRLTVMGSQHPPVMLDVGDPLPMSKV